MRCISLVLKLSIHCKGEVDSKPLDQSPGRRRSATLLHNLPLSTCSNLPVNTREEHPVAWLRIGDDEKVARRGTLGGRLQKATSTQQLSPFLPLS